MGFGKDDGFAVKSAEECKFTKSVMFIKGETDG
jgi:hypothetical protein